MEKLTFAGGTMNDDLKEYYEERAAILEYCAGLPREKAEALARAEVEKLIVNLFEHRNEYV